VNLKINAMNPTPNFVLDYFGPEQAEGYLFVAIGVAAIAFAAWSVWSFDDAIWKGLAIGLVLVGLIQIVVGTTVNLRAPAQIASVQSGLERSETRAATIKTELARMAVVDKNFAYYRWLELAFVVMGLALLLTMRSHSFWLGLGIGLFLQGAIMLSMDQFAERRATRYISALRAL
jgi:hypothetical protein